MTEPTWALVICIEILRCFLLKAVIDSRPNLEVVSGATVTKIHLNVNGKNNVTYVMGDGTSHTDKAKYDVIVAAGALESPKLVKLSGVGNCQELTALGIPCLHENNHVVEHLWDETILSILVHLLHLLHLLQDIM